MHVLPEHNQCYVCHRLMPRREGEVTHSFGPAYPERLAGYSHGICARCLPLERARVDRELREYQRKRAGRHLAQEASLTL